MNGRRSFLKGFGLLGVVVAGASASHAAANLVSESTSRVLPSDGEPVHEPVVCEDVSHLAPPSGAPTVMITGSYEEKPKPVAPACTFGSVYYIASNPVVTNKVSMAVGKDDRLWLQVGDQWRRVALEG